MNRKVSYRWYCAQDLSIDNRLNGTIREWPDHKTLLKTKNEVIQEQIADKSKVNSLIKKLKRIFDKSLNLDAYNLIAKLNPCLRGWGSYFNLGNCAYDTKRKGTGFDPQLLYR